MKFQVDAKTWADGRIELESYFLDGFTGMKEYAVKEVMNTKDAAVHDALVRLGWTPPEDSIDTTPPTNTQ